MYPDEAAEAAGLKRGYSKVARWLLLLVCGAMLAACATAPPPSAEPVASVVESPSTVESLVTAPATPEAGASRTLLVVDEANNPELYFALTQTAERLQALRNYCASFRLRQLTRAQGEELVRVSIDAETCSYPSGDKLIRLVELQSGGATQTQTKRELFRVKGDVYLKSYSGREDGRCAQLVDQAAQEVVDEQIAGAEDMAELMLSDVMSFTLTARSVRLDRFLVDQYAFDNMLVVQEGERSLNFGSRGRLWFAPELGVVVKQEGSFTGQLRITEDAMVDGSFSWEYELRPTGVEPLRLPEDCDFSRSKEIPIFVGGVFVLRGKEGMEFLAQAKTEEIVAFYEGALLSKGWALEYVEQSTAQLRSLKYVRGKEVLFIYISEEQNAEGETVVSVTILLN